MQFYKGWLTECLTDKVTYGQRLEGGDDANHVDTWRRAFQVEGIFLVPGKLKGLVSGLGQRNRMR